MKSIDFRPLFNDKLVDQKLTKEKEKKKQSETGKPNVNKISMDQQQYFHMIKQQEHKFNQL